MIAEVVECAECCRAAARGFVAGPFVSRRATGLGMERQASFTKLQWVSTAKRRAAKGSEGVIGYRMEWCCGRVRCVAAGERWPVQ